MVAYLARISIAFSILLNAIAGGDTNQTISARQWQRKLDGKPNLVWLIDCLFWKDVDHCKESWIKWRMIVEAINSYNTSYYNT